MQLYQKPPLNIHEQVQKLKHRGLLIPDEAHASSCLEQIGFYRLSAYFIPFEDIGNTSIEHAFLENTHFDQILDLYIFDQKLRLLLLESFERLEVAIRSLWANAITIATSDSHAYLHCKHFTSYRQHLKQLNKASSDIDDSNEKFIEHYQRRYKEPALPPTWAMVETLTFSALSRWYKNTSSKAIKTQVADTLGIRTVALMDSVLASITIVRNTAAHHARCWNRPFVKPLPYIKNLAVALNTYNGNQLDNHLYKHLVVISHMMKAIQPTTSWQVRLVSEILTLTPRQQTAMGFPDDWQTMPFWEGAVQQAKAQ